MECPVYSTHCLILVFEGRMLLVHDPRHQSLRFWKISYIFIIRVGVKWKGHFYPNFLSHLKTINFKLSYLESLDLLIQIVI